MSALDAKIDDLYRLPLAEFTAARNTLAKSLSKDDAKLIKALAKPTVVPWAVNQLYWHARATYDRLMKSGEKLRAAQIAALEGRAADVRAASESHRHAISEAVAEAERLASASGTKPGADMLARTFESLSLATSAPGQPGRLTDALLPAGFEALLGITPSEVRSTKSEVRGEKLKVVKPAEKEAAKAAAERQKHKAAVKDAEAQLERVQTAERAAREIWERAHDDLLAARQALTDLRRSRFRSS